MARNLTPDSIDGCGKPAGTSRRSFPGIARLIILDPHDRLPAK